MTQPVPHELDTQLGKGWEEKMLALYSEGAGDSEVAKALNMTVAMFDKLYQAFPIFEEIVAKGRSDARAWFEKLGRQGLHKANGELNFPVWHSYMKNRYGWKDKMEDGDTTHKSAAVMDENELNQKLAEKIKKSLPMIASRTPD
jgi:hypothetical protein